MTVCRGADTGKAVVNGSPVRKCDEAKQGYSCGDGVMVLDWCPISGRTGEILVADPGEYEDQFCWSESPRWSAELSLQDGMVQTC